MPGRRAVGLVLTDAERTELEGLASRRQTAQGLALRARIVLACAGGAQSKGVAAGLGVCQLTVGKWRRRFAEQRLEGLRDSPRPDAPRTVEDERIEALVTATLESVLEDATHWSSRGMARTSGLSVSTVQRVWRAFGRFCCKLVFQSGCAARKRPCINALNVAYTARKRDLQQNLRQYFPKGTHLDAHGPSDLAAVAAALNGRPRKTLGWRTPAEALDAVLRLGQAGVATISCNRGQSIKRQVVRVYSPLGKPG